jgi:hypothetical protein
MPFRKKLDESAVFGEQPQENGENGGYKSNEELKILNNNRQWQRQGIIVLVVQMEVVGKLG